MNKIDRICELPKKSFLLLGPRGTGKSTWLRIKYPNALYLDLLQSDLFLELTSHPEKLRARCAHLKSGDWVIIDEVQRIPELLNEVHWLYENKKIQFGITGSSARKLKKNQTNLLAGRLLRHQMFPLVYPEYQAVSEMASLIDFGSLPGVVTNLEFAKATLSSYLETYIREELYQESIIRKLDRFVRFIETIGQYNGQILNVENIARESSIGRTTVDHYFEILIDTLVGFKLPPYQPGIRKKEVAHSKFYLFDAGVARACSGLLGQSPDRSWQGFAFETIILNELRAYIDYKQKYSTLMHYSVSQGFDIDFIIQTAKRVFKKPGTILSIEVKLGSKVKAEWISTLRDFEATSKDHVQSSHIVYMGTDKYNEDGIQIWPVQDFLKELWLGVLF